MTDSAFVRGWGRIWGMSQLREWSPLEQMIQQQVVDRGISDERLVAAMRKVPRDRFFPAGSKDAVFADRAAPDTSLIEATSLRGT